MHKDEPQQSPHEVLDLSLMVKVRRVVEDWGPALGWKPQARKLQKQGRGEGSNLRLYAGSDSQPSV